MNKSGTSRPTRPPAAKGRPPAGGAKRGISPFWFVSGGIVVLLLAALAIQSFGSSDDGNPSADAPAFGTPSVTGAALPAYGTGTDPAVGSKAPVLRGTDGDGDPVSVGAPASGPTLIVFVAHWCPHCQAEVPRIVKIVDNGDLPDGTRVVAVATGTDATAPNYPPVAWLERENWPGELILDDKDQTAARAYGLSGYPYLVVLDKNGSVVARASGEQPTGAIAAMVKTAAAR